MSYYLEQLSKYSFLAIPFAVVTSVCYQWGYWGEFHIDIFSYLTPSEILVLASVPLLGISFFSLIGFLIAEAAYTFEINTAKNSHKNIVPIKKGIKAFDLFCVFVLVIILFFGGTDKWIYIPLFIGLIIIGLIFLIVFFQGGRLPSKKDFLVITICTLLPFQAFGYAKHKALQVKQGEEYKYFTSDIPSIDTEQNPLRYIGKTSSKVFFYSPETEEVFVFDISQLEPMKIKLFRDSSASNEENVSD
jgi:hypothetical protein